MWSTVQKFVAIDWFELFKLFSGQSFKSTTFLKKSFSFFGALFLALQILIIGLIVYSFGFTTAIEDHKGYIRTSGHIIVALYAFIIPIMILLGIQCQWTNRCELDQRLGKLQGILQKINSDHNITPRIKSVRIKLCFWIVIIQASLLLYYYLYDPLYDPTNLRSAICMGYHLFIMKLFYCVAIFEPCIFLLNGCYLFKSLNSVVKEIKIKLFFANNVMVTSRWNFK